MLTFAFVLAFVATASAQRACSRNGVAGTCVTAQVCGEKTASHSWFSSSASGVDNGCASESADVRCCVVDRGATCAKSGVAGFCLTQADCASIASRVWTASGVDGADSGCAAEPNGVRCCTKVPRSVAPTAPTTSLPPGVTAPPTPPTTTKAPTPAPISITPSGRCNMVTPTCKSFTNACGNRVAYDEEFMPIIAAFDRCASANGVKVGVCSTYRNIAHNRRVGGSSSSNHLVGHAIDFDLTGSNGVVCGEDCMLSPSRLRSVPGVQATLDCIQKHPRVAWGGNPKWAITIRGHLDVVHIDDRLNVRSSSFHRSKVNTCNDDTVFNAVRCESYLLSSAALLEGEMLDMNEGSLPAADPDEGVDNGDLSDTSPQLIGGIVGGLVALIVLGALIAFFWTRYNRKLEREIDGGTEINMR